MFSLQNKIAIATGGGSGIGRAISVLFAQQGATVHILELSEENVAATVTEIETAGSKAIAHTCNVASQKEVKNVFKNIGGKAKLVNGIHQLKEKLHAEKTSGAFVVNTVEALSEVDNNLEALTVSQLEKVETVFIKGTLGVAENGAQCGLVKAA
jgi:NAD(P)-dependent dehydrogenase (short-subunit alcohol dehydrogenase family)